MKEIKQESSSYVIKDKVQILVDQVRSSLNLNITDEQEIRGLIRLVEETKSDQNDKVNKTNRFVKNEIEKFFKDKKQEI